MCVGGSLSCRVVPSALVLLKLCFGCLCFGRLCCVYMYCVYLCCVYLCCLFLTVPWVGLRAVIVVFSVRIHLPIYYAYQNFSRNSLWRVM